MAFGKIMICKVCNKFHPKTFSGRWRAAKGKVYVDDQGRRWEGRTCPPCLSNRHYDGFVIDPMTTRKCRQCDKPLPASRYFNHVNCVWGLTIPYGEHEYGTFCGR